MRCGVKSNLQCWLFPVRSVQRQNFYFPYFDHVQVISFSTYEKEREREISLCRNNIAHPAGFEDRVLRLILLLLVSCSSHSGKIRQQWKQKSRHGTPRHTYTRTRKSEPAWKYSRRRRTNEHPAFPVVPFFSVTVNEMITRSEEDDNDDVNLPYRLLLFTMHGTVSLLFFHDGTWIREARAQKKLGVSMYSVFTHGVVYSTVLYSFSKGYLVPSV